jgi:hypothetical protein
MKSTGAALELNVRSCSADRARNYFSLLSSPVMIRTQALASGEGKGVLLL